MQHRREQRRAVEEQGVDDLSPASRLGAVQPHEGSDHDEHAATAEVPEQIGRWRRRLSSAAEHVKGAGERKVVDVVPVVVGRWTRLTPAGRTDEGQSGISLQACIRCEPEAFGYPGAETLDEYVGALDELADGPLPVGVFEVKLQLDAASVQDRAGQLPLPDTSRSGGGDPEDLGTEIGQNHTAERSGADAGEFQDAHAGQWPLTGYHDRLWRRGRPVFMTCASHRAAMASPAARSRSRCTAAPRPPATW